MNAPFDKDATSAVRNTAFQSLLADYRFAAGLRAIEYKYQLERGWTLGVAFQVFAQTTSSVGATVNYILTAVRRHARAEMAERVIGPRGPRVAGLVARIFHTSLDAPVMADVEQTLQDLLVLAADEPACDFDRGNQVDDDQEDWRTTDSTRARRARAWLSSIPLSYRDVGEAILDGLSREQIIARAGVGDKRVRQACGELLGDDDGSQLDLFQMGGRNE